MATTQNQRPRFYEGQFLGADDLATIVEYLRTADARHALGAHTWGIAAGLHLTEKPAPGAPDRVEITLQPGFAWDGFGRLIVNTRPVRLREDLFAAIPYAGALDDVANGRTGRLVPVWLQYDETAAGNPAPGFDTCATDDEHSRIGELFRFEIGERTDVQQRSSLTIGTATVDALKALQAYYMDPANSVPPRQAAPNLWDTSVPHQQLPIADKPPLWLIPIGCARWVARDQALGYFARRDLNAADNAVDRIRAFRRYIGVVAESIEAADAAIVLHRRGDRPNGPHRFTNLLRSGKAEDLLKDLVWVEGNLRVIGDERLAGGALRFTDADGGEQKTPLYVARAGDNPAPVAEGNRELRIFIGPAGQTTNRLIVGREQAGPPVTAAPSLVVVSSGRAGVGTRDPATSLEVVGDWNGGEGAIRVTGDQPAVRFEPGNAGGKQPWVVHVTDTPAGNLRLAYKDNVGTWKGVLHATPTGKVGVVADKPRNPLGVRAAGAAQDLVSFEDPGGATKWHISQKTADGATDGLSIVETPSADGEGRLFIKTGGNIGMGTVAPGGRLTIKSPLASQGTLSFFTATADIQYDGGGDALFRITHTGNGVTSFLQTQIGIGTENPRAPLGIRAAATDFQELVNLEEPGGQVVWEILRSGAGIRGLNFRDAQAGKSRLMLTENGRVGVGTAAPSQALHVAGSFARVDGAGNEQAYIGGDGAANDVQVGSLNGGVTTVSLWNVANGQPMDLGMRDLNCNHIEYASAHMTSDATLKQDVEPITQALDGILRLHGVHFRWKPGAGHEGEDFGVIAQEVASVFPQLVRESRRGLSVSYTSLIPVLIEAVKTLKKDIDALRASVERLAGGAPRAARRRNAEKGQK